MIKKTKTKAQRRVLFQFYYKYFYVLSNYIFKGKNALKRAATSSKCIQIKVFYSHLRAFFKYYFKSEEPTQSLCVIYSRNQFLFLCY